MGIFDTLKGRIFGHPDAPAASPAPISPPAGAPPEAPLPVKQKQAVDVETVLDHIARGNGQPSNWRTSIVDLMKLVNMDSSLAARKELARDLGYTGDMNDSATMNIWLHGQVMAKLGETRV